MQLSFSLCTIQQRKNSSCQLTLSTILFDALLGLDWLEKRARWEICKQIISSTQSCPEANAITQLEGGMLDVGGAMWG